MKSQKTIILAAFLFLLGVLAHAQSPAAGVSNISTLTRLQNGVDLYAQGLYDEALTELRRVEAETQSRAQKAEALYWIGITELSSGRYEAALVSMDALEVFDPRNTRIAELPYHKGRALFYLDRYNESIVFFGNYIDKLPVDRNGAMDSRTGTLKASALYWIGECLFSMGQMDKAEEVYQQIIDGFPDSYKYEASYYRISLIAQKKVEQELLELLKWTHEESIKTIEEYRRREHTYEQALIAYQKRIADILRDSRLSELEDENARFRQSIVSSEERIRSLENELRSARASAATQSQTNSASAAEQVGRSGSSASRLSTMRNSAVNLMEEIRKAEGN